MENGKEILRFFAEEHHNAVIGEISNRSFEKLKNKEKLPG